MGRATLVLSLLAIANGVLGFPKDIETRKRSLGETRTENGVTYQCKCYQDNTCWPNAGQWRSLNATLGGQLQVALPPGAVCYKNGPGEYDAAECAETQANWANEQWLTDHPTAALWPVYTNNTCLPTDNPAGTCTQGFYSDYVIVATTEKHIKTGVDFARKHNLRLLIRNTGHDFMGRSTGYGTLMINTHNFKDTTFGKQYSGPGGYTGSYVTAGAGVQGRELYRKAFAQSPKVVVVGGECPTVGWAGGYIQGGGHGPLSTIYGMGADNVLSFTAITANGEYVTANAVENPDLFWALKGGGPSTFAVVTSVTAKTFPEIPVAAANLNINFTHTTDIGVFNEGFRIFHNLSNYYTENDMFVYFELSTLRFHVQPFVAPRMTEAKLRTVLKPLQDQLKAANIPHEMVFKGFPTFFEMYIDMFEDEPPNQQSYVGGRLFTQKDMATRANQVADALIFANQPVPDIAGGFSIGHIVNPGRANPVVDNAIHPDWRRASSFVITNTGATGQETWAEKLRLQDITTNVVGKALREAGPDGAGYVNEGDLNEPNWQETYWGSNYPRLLSIKEKWDPTGLFFAETTPGTEDWEVIDYGKKLCKKV